MGERILILGACGQIGTELTQKLRELYGKDAVIASDIKKMDSENIHSGLFEILDASDKEAILQVVQKL